MSFNLLHNLTYLQSTQRNPISRYNNIATKKLSMADEWISFNALLMEHPHQRGRNTAKKKKKKSYDNWFESCKVEQLKELCKASKLKVAGTKQQLCQRLLTSTPETESASMYSGYKQYHLKEILKEKLLVQSGTKYEQILRLIRFKFGTGPTSTVKRDATETITDETTGKEIQVAKKRKISIPTPKQMHSRVSKKMNAVTQKKYQSHYGSKNHSPDVYNLMRTLIKENCVDNKLVDTNPSLAVEMCLGVFHAFDENWHVMVRTGYETNIFREAIDLFGDVLKKNCSTNNSESNNEQIENIVSTLESIQTNVNGYCLHTRMKEDCAVYYSTGEGSKNTESYYTSILEEYKTKRYAEENVIMDTIRIIMPSYDKKKRPEKQKKFLSYELEGMKGMVF